MSCNCAWNPVVGWIVCEECCNIEVPCTHLMEELEEYEEADE